jgi:hypothetical protein
MHVGVNQAGHDHPAMCVQDLDLGIGTLQIRGPAYCGDDAILDSNAAILDQRLDLVARDQPPMAHQQD